MFRFRMTVAGEVAMDRGLARFTDGISDWRPIWPVFGDEFYAHLKAQFETEGEAGLGSKWKPLSEVYAAWKERHFPGKKILERTGELKASLSSRTAAGSVYEERPQSLTIGSSIPYGIYHQTGGRKLPQRKEIALDERTKRELMRLAQAYLVQIATNAGWRRGMSPTDAAALAAARAKYRSWPGGSA